MRLIIGRVFFFLVSCATQKVEVIQQENCYQYKTFPEFHRCSEKVVKGSFDYKFSFERDIIDQYFAFGEVLALQVEKKTKDNIEAFEIWGEELDKAVVQAELRGKEATELAIITAAIAVTAYIIYKEQKKIKEVKNLTSSTSRTVSSFVNPQNQSACNYGKYIYSMTGRINGYMGKC
jgi:hypothetical protein